MTSRSGKLTGRAFYESIGSPKMILAPMVDRSEFVGSYILVSK
jgi:tRNA-dihydrouridine synthase 1